MISAALPQPCEIHPEVEPLEETSPFTLEFFVVQGIGFRCMAYCDDDGKWREAFYNGELPGPIRVLQ